MKRNAFIMKLKKGFEDEYKRRHDEIWPELAEVLTKAGISDYSIYLDQKSLTLFAFQKLSDDNTADQLPNNPVVRKWWDYMADIMEYNPDNTPVAIGLKEVFHMD
jgi:L-rhamnose mutarotase